MQLRRYLQSGALFADALNSVTDLENLGYTVNGNPTIVDSQFGKAISFASGDWIALGNVAAASTIKTILYRVNHPSISGTDAHISIASEVWSLFSNVGTLTDIGITSPTYYIDGVENTTFQANKWQTVAVTTATALSGVGLELVSIGSGAIDGALRMRDVMLFDRVLTAAEILSIHNGSVFQYDRNLVSLWDMSTINTIPDLGHRNLGNDGVGVSLTSASIVDGHRGMLKSIEFDGVSDFIQFTEAQTDSFRFNGSTQDFSVSLWCRKATSGEIGTLLDCRDGIGDGWRIFVTDSDVVCNLNSQSTDIANSDTSWHHVIMVADRNGVMGIYLDGIRGGTIDISAQTLATTVGSTIGRWSSSSGSFFAGRIDDVRIYDTSLTNLQVRDIYEQSR